MNVSIRLLRESELGEANRIFRLAFGTFLGLPDPMSFMGDAELVRGRWRTDPTAALAAELDGRLVGSNFVAHWGSFGFFGPLTVLPDLWDKGIAKRLLEATMDLFEAWGTRHAALFTFPQSPKHIGLYQKFGFWPRFLTPVMSKSVGHEKAPRWSKFSDVPASDREACLNELRNLTDAVYPGLDLGREISSLADRQAGETLFRKEAKKAVGVAVCHIGAGSEGGTGTCYVKFAAVRPGSAAPKRFAGLLAACEGLAAERGASQIVAGVNAAREGAYRAMVERGFRTFLQGVAMQRPNEAGYNRPDRFVIDDWR